MMLLPLNEKTMFSLDIVEADLDTMLEKEWLLTNSRGSYASGTVIGCNTRRYHGLLVASLHPPVERHVALSNMLEMVQCGGETAELSNFEFSDRLHPQGYKLLKCFRRGCGVHFVYQVKQMQICKSIYLDYDHDNLVMIYRFSGVEQPMEFKLIPMVALRDFHGLQSSATAMETVQEEDTVVSRVLNPQGPAVHFYSPDFVFDSGADWWYAMRYRMEARRGQHDYEDVWVPGIFSTTVQKDVELVFVAGATRAMQHWDHYRFDIREWVARQNDRLEKIYQQASAGTDAKKVLVRAADQFIVRRQINNNAESASILAGYHWFADWARDTFIALPGLLLTTGRHAEALEVLMTFGGVISQGQVPNRFDDYGGEPHYNSIDASLWFIHAAWCYLQATGDQECFDKKLRPMLLEIVENYTRGTRDAIHEDADGLISGGSYETQLTWMDAKCNGVAFTPRYGKAVEINALWYNALMILKETSPDAADKKNWTARANHTKKSFAELFWNEEGGYLNDCVYPDGGIDKGVRPNQIYAVSLPFSCLSLEKQQAVVRVVEEQLLTPYGLRSLSPRDNRYRGVYGGDQFQRDSVYHQGTVWGYLIGPYIDAYLKIHQQTPRACQEAMELLKPLLNHLMTDGCLGSIAEIFDGDFPHRPNGAMAQAWSVAEALRTYTMLTDCLKQG